MRRFRAKRALSPKAPPARRLCLHPKPTAEPADDADGNCRARYFSVFSRDPQIRSFFNEIQPWSQAPKAGE
jgi:hypothetical protein